MTNSKLKTKNSTLHKSDKIYVAGHRGLVGSAIVRNLEKKGYNNLLLRTSKELNLTNQADVNQFFETEKPDYIFLAAAKVGGIRNVLHRGRVFSSPHPVSFPAHLSGNRDPAVRAGPRRN